MPIKIIPIIGLIFFLFLNSCVNSSPEEVENWKLAKACVEPIPFISLDSVKVKQAHITYFLSDQFEVTDWYFYEEVIFYLWNDGCFKEALKNAHTIDSVSFTISHNEQSVTTSDSPEKISSYAKLRADAGNYYAFFEKELGRPNFRGELILLSHLFGKIITPNPNNGTIYNENILGFLLQVDTECGDSHSSPQNKLLFQNLIEQLENHAQVDTIKNSMDIFNQCFD